MRIRQALMRVCRLAYGLLLWACAHPTEPTVPARDPAVVAVDAARLMGAAADSANWLTHGRTYDEQRFSPLQQIAVENVHTLGLAWAYDLDTERGQEATPLVIDGVMYATSAFSKLQALEAATGKLLWQYDPKVQGAVTARLCCDAVNRGVAAYAGRLYLGTLDGRLIAVDGQTGREVWSVQTTDPEQPYSIVGAPRIVKGKVLIGNAGDGLGVRGYVSAYDAETGQQHWRFYTVPGDPARPAEAPVLASAAQTWSGAGGGGTVPDAIVYDPALDLVFIGTGAGSPWNQRIRSQGRGDNLFLSSIVALRPDTGEYVWHYQTTPGDSWGYAATAPMILAELTLQGVHRQVLLQANANGYFYVLDRATGKLLSAKPFATVGWAQGVDLSSGRPIINPVARYETTGKPWFGMPSPYGAHAWQALSFSPDTRLVYLGAQDIPFAYVDDPSYRPRSLGENRGIDGPSTSLPRDVGLRAQVLASVRGFLRAWDPVAQREIWRVEQPGAWNGGVLSTAGALVFAGNGAGQLNAYHATTGATLWSFHAQGGIVAAPIAFASGGDEYVAIVVGSGGAFPLAAGELARKGAATYNKSRILAFRLGASLQLPQPPAAAAPPQPPEQFGDAELLQVGMRAFHNHCSRCHGDTAVSGGGLPDLRRSPALSDVSRWQDIVLSGVLAARGMVSFRSVLEPSAAEAIRAYLVERAHEALAVDAVKTERVGPPRPSRE